MKIKDLKIGDSFKTLKAKVAISINWCLSFFGLCVDTEGPWEGVALMYGWFLVSSVLVIGLDRGWLERVVKRFKTDEL
jgi:hypothetical protein